MARQTDKDCSNDDCESNYHRDGHELFCPTCGYTPDAPTEVVLEPAYKSFMERDENENGRTRYAGGYVDAYFGTGEYSYSFENGSYQF